MTDVLSKENNSHEFTITKLENKKINDPKHVDILKTIDEMSIGDQVDITKNAKLIYKVEESELTSLEMTLVFMSKFCRFDGEIKTVEQIRCFSKKFSEEVIERLGK